MKIDLLSYMKLAIAFLFITSGLAFADYQKSLGISPDKAYEIIAKGQSQEDREGQVFIKNVKTGKLQETFLGCLDLSIASTQWEVIWNGDSVFAVTCDGLKAQMGYAIYKLNKSEWQEITSENNYFENILGRQGVIRSQKRRIAFGRFEGENRYSIWCYCEPDCLQWEAAKKSSDWKPSPSREWLVTFEYASQGSSSSSSVVEIKPLN